MNASTVKPTPLHIEVTLNNEETGAILHINCQSDGKRARWSNLKDKEEGSEQAKRGWLGKLGCLLKVHGNITCEWFHSTVGLTPTCHILQTYSTTHGHIGLQTFLRTTNSLSRSARWMETIILKKITIYMVGPPLPLLCTTLLTIYFRWRA